MNFGPTDALIVVDVQRDFCPGGALPVDEGDAVAPVINLLSPHFELLVFTRDFHPANHCSFAANPEFADGSWPAHCVVGSPGVEFLDGLEIPQHALMVEKGTRADREAYSGFDGTDLCGMLRKQGVERIVVCGLATDYCVKATALDGVSNGFEVLLVEDGCRAVDSPEGSGLRALAEMQAAGVAIRRSGDLLE